MSEHATRTMRAAVLGASLMADSGFSRGAELEDVEGDRIEEAGGNVESHTAGLSAQARFAEAEQRQRTLNATRRDVLPEQRSEDMTPENQAASAEAQEAIRQDSLMRDVAELGPTRAMRQQVADEAAKMAAKLAQDKAQELIARLAVFAADDVGGGLVEVTEGAALETDLGIGTITDVSYKYTRFGRTILIPQATNVGTTARDAVQYTANKALDLALPPYKFIFGGANMADLADDADLAFTLLVTVPVILIIGLTAFIVFMILAYGYYYLGSLLDINAILSLLT